MIRNLERLIIIGGILSFIASQILNSSTKTKPKFYSIIVNDNFLEIRIDKNQIFNLYVHLTV